MTRQSAKAAAEEQAAKDLALLQSLQKRDTPKPGPTIGDNFVASAGLLAEVRVKTRLSEATLLKLFELQMMWALNNRNQPNYGDDLIGPEVGGDDEGEVDLPTPHEIITEINEETEA